MAKLSDLTPDASNANRGTERGRYALEASLRKYGAGRSILIDRNGRIIAGNKTAETAADVGIDDVIIVQTNGRQIVAVQRTDLDLDSKEARELAYADNRVGELDLSFDPEQMLADLQAGVDLGQFWRQDELDELLADLTPKTTGDTEPQTDRAEELREKWQTAAGQLWQLGEHRLICGDCTDAATVARVMGGDRADMVFTSPPYNSASELHGNDKFRGSLYLDKSIDSMTPEQYLNFNQGVFAGIKSILAVDGNVYYNISYNKNNRSGWVLVVANAIADGFNLYETIIWKKRGMPNPASTDVLTRDFEFVFLFNQSGTYRTNKANSEARSNIWEINNAGVQEENHKACFPVELPSRGILESTISGAIVYEPFAGSGTTLIACENLRRRCRAVEISPAYVAVAIQRWADHCGGQPVLLD